ncbi:MAG: ribokinase [Streptosporangiales bacterium]|nr:ribokinase [Streptosporangiales bacterium]
MQERRHEVVVVGSLNADLVVRVSDRPGAGETVLGSDLATYPGGKGANQAVAAGRVGGSVAMVGRVGADGHGRLLRGSLGDAGVDAAHVLDTDRPTGVAMIIVDGSGDNSIVVSPGANGALTPDDVAAAGPVIARASVLCLQLEIPFDTLGAAARAAAEAGTRVVLNLAPAAAIPEETLKLCDPLVVNEHEAAFLLGTGVDAVADPDGAAAALRELGPRSVVITLGATGAYVADDTETASLPAPSVTAVDTTGAGDAFVGALAVRLARGDGLATAAAYAVKVGAAVVQREGAQSSFPTPAEVATLT